MPEACCVTRLCLGAPAAQGLAAPPPGMEPWKREHGRVRLAGRASGKTWMKREAMVDGSSSYTGSKSAWVRFAAVSGAAWRGGRHLSPRLQVNDVESGAWTGGSSCTPALGAEGSAINRIRCADGRASLRILTRVGHIRTPSLRRGRSE